MLSDDDYLQLLPKTELHCHFVSTMGAALFVELAAKNGVELPSTDPATLFDFTDLVQLANNSFEASWLSPARRDAYLAAVAAYAHEHAVALPA